MTMSIIISAQDARELAFIDGGKGRKYVTSGGAAYEVVANRDHGERRWTMIMELVVKAEDGMLFRAFYERGLTESQFERPFEYNGDMINFERVKAVEVASVAYESDEGPMLAEALGPPKD
jgi:hypothetical protein